MASSKVAPLRSCAARETPVRSASVKSAPASRVSLRSIPERLVCTSRAPRRSAPARRQPARLAPRRLAPRRSAPHRSASDRSASSRSASTNIARDRSAPLRSRPTRFAFEKSRPARFAPHSSSGSGVSPVASSSSGASLIVIVRWRSARPTLAVSVESVRRPPAVVRHSRKAVLPGARVRGQLLGRGGILVGDENRAGLVLQLHRASGATLFAHEDHPLVVEDHAAVSGLAGVSLVAVVDVGLVASPVEAPDAMVLEEQSLAFPNHLRLPRRIALEDRLREDLQRA